jgi:hypothetical protein
VAALQELPHWSVPQVWSPQEHAAQVLPVVQYWVAEQALHWPPQPLSPQILPVQSGTQHWPLSGSQTCLAPVQDPHVPPQPSSPQTLPVQSGRQGHASPK